jgi:hypothetical protein
MAAKIVTSPASDKACAHHCRTLLTAGILMRHQATGPQAATAAGWSSIQTVAVPFASNSGGGLNVVGRF